MAFLDLWKAETASVWLRIGKISPVLTLPELKGPYRLFLAFHGNSIGLPFAAADARIGAAVLGMWGANYPNSVLVEREIC